MITNIMHSLIATPTMFAVMPTPDTRLEPSNTVGDRPPPVEYSVELDKDMHYGNDVVSGRVRVRTRKNLLLPYVKVAVVGSFRTKQPFLSDGVEACKKIYTASKVLCRNFVAEAGSSTIPFSFHLPADMPSTISHGFCNITWDVRLFRVHGNNNHVLAFKKFQTTALYYAHTNSPPRVQYEVPNAQTGQHLLRAELSLSKDVYGLDEPVDFTVALHKLDKHVKVKSIHAKIIQKVVLNKSVGSNETNVTVDESLFRHKECKAKWVSVASGSVATHSSCLLPKTRAKSRFDVAKSTYKGEHGSTFSLSPSIRLANSEGLNHFTVSYSVQVGIKMKGSDDVCLRVPFFLQGSTDGVDCLLDFYTFPVPLVQPPEYQSHEDHSVGSYTTLRRDSINSVLVNKCNTPEVYKKPLVPDEAFIAANELKRKSKSDTARLSSIFSRAKFGMRGPRSSSIDVQSDITDSHYVAMCPSYC